MVRAHDAAVEIQEAHDRRRGVDHALGEVAFAAQLLLHESTFARIAQEGDERATLAVVVFDDGHVDRDAGAVAMQSFHFEDPAGSGRSDRSWEARHVGAEVRPVFRRHQQACVATDEFAAAMAEQAQRSSARREDAAVVGDREDRFDRMLQQAVRKRSPICAVVGSVGEILLVLHGALGAVFGARHRELPRSCGLSSVGVS